MQKLIATHLHMYAYSEWYVEQGKINWFRAPGTTAASERVALCGPHSLNTKTCGGTAVYPVKEKTTELGRF